MKLRWIILGISLFVWSTLVSELLGDYFNLDVIGGRPVLYFIILVAGVLIGKGLTQRS